MSWSIVILGIVLALIAARQLAGLRLRIWQIMLGGALAVLVTGQISLPRAVAAIDVEVMLFLFGIFTVGRGMEDSGYLASMSEKLLGHARSANRLLLLVLFGSAAASAILMNDTVAIIGTPVMIWLARQTSIKPAPLLLALAFGITIGSTASPIGSPQNLLIASRAFSANSFLVFARYLLLPTLLNIVVAFLLLRWMFRGEFHPRERAQAAAPVAADRRSVIVSKLSLVVLGGLIAARIATNIAGLPHWLPLSGIALISAAVVLVGMPHRARILVHLDWGTFIFFAAMFVLMQSVWDTRLFHDAIEAAGPGVRSPRALLLMGILASQVVSNVPLVAMYLPILTQANASATQYMALAAGSTIAGNLSIIGAASNVIIIQNAESRNCEPPSFLTFLKSGLPLTAANAIVYWLFLR